MKLIFLTLIFVSSTVIGVAQNVAWQPPVDTQGDASLSKLGTLVDAVYTGQKVKINDKPVGDLTIGDTPFHPILLAPTEGQSLGSTYSDGTISLTTAGKAEFYSAKLNSPTDEQSMNNALPVSTGVSPEFSALLSNGMFYQGLAVGSLDFAKLTPGHLYQVQMWAFIDEGRQNVSNFIDALGNIGTINAGAHVPRRGPLTPGQPYGQSITGVFLAKDSTASIDWCGGYGSTYPTLNALALRDVTDVAGMKETVAAVGNPTPIQPIHDRSGFDEWKDLTYIRIGRHSVKLDLYVPNDTQKAATPPLLVVYIHGGGWGWLDKTEGFANGLIKRGFAVANVDYRLSGEAPWPAQIYDCKAAVRWLRAHAADYGYRADKVGVMGDSAGGHLVSMLGLTNDNPDFEGAEGTPGVSSSVQAVADYFGPSDLSSMMALASSPVQQLLGGSPSDMMDRALKASPMTYVSAKAPPFVIVHGDQDKTVPIQSSINLNSALLKAGVDSQMYVMKGKPHGANEGPAMDMVVAMFNKYLR